MNAEDVPPLPAAVTTLLSGNDLPVKIGTTLLLSTSDERGWPHLALLSVGEVLAMTPGDLRLALHATSGTAAAARHSGRALLTVIINGTPYRIRLLLNVLDGAGDPGRSLTLFHGRVRRWDEDQVGYADVTSGITYALHDESTALRRWHRQLDQLRKAAP